MRQDYEDIRSRIAEAPKWWDENGVPRYCDFGPRRVADVYADEAALVLIECQECGRNFEVAFSRSRGGGWNVEQFLYERIERKSLAYRDPPNTGCCPSGPTMMSISMKVLQYWSRLNTAQEWRRDPRFEVMLEE